jgi:hypothetical protein
MHLFTYRGSKIHYHPVLKTDNCHNCFEEEIGKVSLSAWTDAGIGSSLVKKGGNL